MRKNVKELLAFVMAMSVIWGLLSVNVAAAGEGENGGNAYEDTYTYVLNFSGQNIEGYEDYDAKRLYASDHYAGLLVDEDGDGVNESDWNWTCFSVLNMINTGKLSEGGEGAYASIPAYCVDAVTDGVSGYEYRRINLEDSAYFDDNVAGCLRAIILNSFPYVTDMSAVAAAVNGWNTANGGNYGEVVNLTESEVISATQAAIWTLTNNAEVYAPYLGTGGYYTESEMVDTVIFHQAKSDYTEGNITALYHYLMALAPMTAQSTLVSGASFVDTKVSLFPKECGNYTAVVTASITAEVQGNTQLTLTVVSDGKVVAAETVEDGTHEYTLTIAEVTNADVIMLAIDGVQEASDVFLFDPLNGYKASQSMAGYDDSALPVHAETTVEPEMMPETEPETTQEETTMEETTEESELGTTSEETTEESEPETTSEETTEESEPETTSEETTEESEPETTSEETAQGTEAETTQEDIEPESESQTESEEITQETEPETIQETEQEIESEAKSESTTEETESVTMSEKTPQAPNTGEVAEAGITFWLAVAVISCTGIGLMLLIKRHRERL